MKFTINQNKDITDVEIIINCPYIDDDIRQLIDCVHQYAGTLLGYIDSEMYSVPLNRILYIECTDKKTFFYDEKCVYLCRETISALEKSLSKAFFIRVSKNFIINLNQLLCLQPSDNHKLEAVMKNGEHIIVSRSYAQSLKNQFTMSDSKHPILDKYSGKVDLPQIEHAHRSVFNLGRILNLYHTPERVLALSYGEAEIMAALGLTNNLTAIAPAECSLQDVLPRFRAELSSIPVMLNNNIGIPNSESIQELHIDFILGTAFSRYSHRQVYESAKLDNMFYIFEATARECATLESLYHDILNLGRIFHVENRAMSIVEKARKKVAAILGNFRIKTYKKVFVYDSGKSQPSTTGANTLENNIISMSGGKNIFENHDDCYFNASWEDVIKADPEYIIVHNFSDLITLNEKIDYLKSRSDLQSIRAVRENNIIPLTLLEVLPSAQIVDTIEKLAKAFHSGNF